MDLATIAVLAAVVQSVAATVLAGLKIRDRLRAQQRAESDGSVEPEPVP